LNKSIKETVRFLKTYKGKYADMLIDRKISNAKDASYLVKAANAAYYDHMRNCESSSHTVECKKPQETTPTPSISNRVRVVRR
jgi:hypothetical protein